MTKKHGLFKNIFRNNGYNQNINFEAFQNEYPSLMRRIDSCIECTRDAFLDCNGDIYDESSVEDEEGNDEEDNEGENYSKVCQSYI